MFGMGFTEILFIAIVAIIFLGPDKLPDAMVQIAKLFKSVKGVVSEAKSSFENEIHIKELREEALNYRKQFEEAKDDISGFKNSIPNPAAELQDAITSIGGERYLDEDILADIDKAENSAEIVDNEVEDKLPIENTQPEDTEAKEDAEQASDSKQSKKKKKSKSKKVNGEKA